MFRSKFCNYVADADADADADEGRCSECRLLSVELGLKLAPEKSEQLPPDPDTSEFEVEKRKRGRPRGSKTKNFVVSVADAVNEDTDVKDEVSTDVVVKRENGDDDDQLAMSNSGVRPELLL